MLKFIISCPAISVQFTQTRSIDFAKQILITKNENGFIYKIPFRNFKIIVVVSVLFIKHCCPTICNIWITFSFWFRFLVCLLSACQLKPFEQTQTVNTLNVSNSIHTIFEDFGSSDKTFICGWKLLFTNRINAKDEMKSEFQLWNYFKRFVKWNHGTYAKQLGSSPKIF